MGHAVINPAHTLWSDSKYLSIAQPVVGFSYHDLRIIDSHRTCLSTQIPSKTAPEPPLRRIHQPTLNRVANEASQSARAPSEHWNHKTAPARIGQDEQNWGARQAGLS